MAPALTSSALTIVETPIANFRGYDHVTWYVGNAKFTASYYVTRMGFKVIGYRGLETGSQSTASWVVNNGRATFVLVSPIRGDHSQPNTLSGEDQYKLQEIHDHLRTHGDAVKDVAFEVDNLKALYANAVAKGAVSVKEPMTVSDRDGELVTATIKTYGDTTHTFVERTRYHGAFMPGYRAVVAQDPVADHLPPISFENIDHCVGNQNWNDMETACT